MTWVTLGSASKGDDGPTRRSRKTKARRAKADKKVGQIVGGPLDPKAKYGAERLRSFGLFEANAGYTQPYRETYIHPPCGKIHRLSVRDAELLATAPTHFRYAYCAHCGDWDNITRFIWNDGKGTIMGSRQNYSAVLT